jgi:hypothetical protein
LNFYHGGVKKRMRALAGFRLGSTAAVAVSLNGIRSASDCQRALAPIYMQGNKSAARRLARPQPAQITQCAEGSPVSIEFLACSPRTAALPSSRQSHSYRER